MVGNRHTGSEVQLFEFAAELGEAETGAVCDLSAAVQVQHLNATAVQGKRPAR